MAQSKEQSNESKPAEPELRPDGWQQFESAVDAAMKPKAKVKPADVKHAAASKRRDG